MPLHIIMWKDVFKTFPLHIAPSTNAKFKVKLEKPTEAGNNR